MTTGEARRPSPSYPSLDLRAAADRLRRLVAVAPAGTDGPEATQEALGFRAGSGPANRAVAALGQFGLLGASGCGHAATPLGLRLLGPPTADALAARREALARPAAHAVIEAEARRASDSGRREPTRAELVAALEAFGYFAPVAAAIIDRCAAGRAWAGDAPPPADASAGVPDGDGAAAERTDAPAAPDLDPPQVTGTPEVPAPATLEGRRPSSGELDEPVVRLLYAFGECGPEDAVLTVTTLGDVSDAEMCRVVRGWVGMKRAELEGWNPSAPGDVADPYAGLRPHPVGVGDLLSAGVASVGDLVDRVNRARALAGADPVGRDEFPVRLSQFLRLASELAVSGRDGWDGGPRDGTSEGPRP